MPRNFNHLTNPLNNIDFKNLTLNLVPEHKSIVLRNQILLTEDKLKNFDDFFAFSDGATFEAANELLKLDVNLFYDGLFVLEDDLFRLIDQKRPVKYLEEDFMSMEDKGTYIFDNISSDYIVLLNYGKNHNSKEIFFWFIMAVEKSSVGNTELTSEESQKDLYHRTPAVKICLTHDNDGQKKYFRASSIYYDVDYDVESKVSFEWLEPKHNIPMSRWETENDCLGTIHHCFRYKHDSTPFKSNLIKEKLSAIYNGNIVSKEIHYNNGKPERILLNDGGDTDPKYFNDTWKHIEDIYPSMRSTRSNVLFW